MKSFSILTLNHCWISCLPLSLLDAGLASRASTYLACLGFEAGNIARSSVGQFQFTAFVKTDWNNLLKGLVSTLSSSYIVFVGHVFV